MDVSVIIVNWNSKDYIRGCLRSFAAHPPTVSYEVIVVDSGSFDGCDAMLAAEFPQVRYVQSKENIGFAKANNLGARHATGTYLLLLNPDTEIHPRALEELIAPFENDPRVGAAGARLLNTDGTLQTSCVQAFPSILNLLVGSDLWLKWFPGSKIMGRDPLTSKAEYPDAQAISGAAILMKRTDYTTIGGFDESYFMYSEDIDLCRTVHANSKRVVYCRNAVITHHGGGSSKKQEEIHAITRKIQARQQFLGKWHSNSYSACFKQITLIVFSCRLASAYCLMRADLSRFKNQFYAARKV
ncbi:glycosyltransferase family 2 protein [Nibricoccus sp. IMCC34717]|uniref:glycosyltransferase family 2 protein n=1 Tax=Nibricoccus sp. IMCC34717 TaxID=3034021 RepID=UPI00384E3576